jgi:hypothetical protein
MSDLGFQPGEVWSQYHFFTTSNDVVRLGTRQERLHKQTAALLFLILALVFYAHLSLAWNLEANDRNQPVI